MSFIIAIKRKNSNSKLLYKAKYLHAKDFELSPQTFCKYLNDCILLGWIKKEENGYQVIKLKSILREICVENGKMFAHHNILKSKELNFRAILRSVEEYLVQDNVIAPQEYLEAINNGMKVSTAKRAKHKRPGMGYGMKTSARGVSRRTGFSIAKSNEIMNRAYFIRKELINIFHSRKARWEVENLKVIYPNSHVFYSERLGKCVVHHGSKLSLSCEVPLW